MFMINNSSTSTTSSRSSTNSSTSSSSNSSSSSKSSSSGSYGFYSHKNGIGIKVLYISYQTRAAAIESDTFKDAIREAIYGTVLGKIKSPIKVPKYYSVDVVRRDGEWHVAILMQHIAGETAMRAGISNHSDDDQEVEAFEKIKKQIDKMSRKAKIAYSDIHDENLIVKKNGNVYLIDFSSEYTCFEGSKRKWKQLVNELFPKFTKELKKKISKKHHEILLWSKEDVLKYV